jgi:hypothetical protein
VPWFFQNFLGVDGWGLGGWFLLSNNDYSCILLRLFTCLKWCSILLIEVWRSSSLSVIMCDWSGFISFWLLLLVKCFHQIVMIAS